MTLPCPDWVWSTNSNVSVAKDRSWFGDDYIPFSSFAEDQNGKWIGVVGIGTVHLATKNSPSLTGPLSHGTLHLKNVLHAPEIGCNIIGRSVLADYGVTLYPSASQGGPRGWIRELSSDGLVAYFKPFVGELGIYRVRLSGPPVGPRVGPSPFHSSSLQQLPQVSWPDCQRQNLRDILASRQSQAAASGPLTPIEKAWLRTRHAKEYKFMLKHGALMLKDEYEKEGSASVRALLRALVNHGIAGHPQVLSSEPLTQTENAWLAKYYGNLSNFLGCQKLGLSNDNGQEAFALVRALMYHDRFDQTQSEPSGSMTHAENEMRDLYYGNTKNYLDIFGFEISSERGRQEARRNFRDLMYKVGISQSQAPAPGHLTRKEQEWLIEKYGNEYNFLQRHGLSIFEEGDREQAFDIMRASISKEEAQKPQYLCPGAILLPARVEPIKDEERAWLKKHYGSEYKFLLAFGLKIHNKEEREQGRAMLRTFMANDDDEIEL